METVNIEKLQNVLNTFANKDVYVHLETTNGAYASHFDEKVFNAGAFIRNVVVQFELGKVTAEAPHRVGLKLANGGWVYAQGITHYEVDSLGRLLMAGHDYEGKLAVALEISEQPFAY